jgi:hypothetical protein
LGGDDEKLTFKRVFSCRPVEKNFLKIIKLAFLQVMSGRRVEKVPSKQQEKTSAVPQDVVELIDVGQNAPCFLRNVDAPGGLGAIGTGVNIPMQILYRCVESLLVISSRHSI